MKTTKANRFLFYAVMIFIPFVSGISVHAATLESFTATTGSDHVLVSWETSIQEHTAGFFMQRSTKKTIGFERLNNIMVPVKGYPTVGALYSYEDYSVDQTMTTTYYYKLEEVVDNSAYTTVLPEIAGPVTFPPADSESTGGSAGCFIMTTAGTGG